MPDGYARSGETIWPTTLLQTAVNLILGEHWTQRLFDLSLNEWWLLAVTFAHTSIRARDMSEMLVMDKSHSAA